MNVSLVSVSPDAEKHMAYCARVSNPNNQDNENYAGLLRYCIKHQHWSIFEQTFVNEVLSAWSSDKKTGKSLTNTISFICHFD